MSQLISNIIHNGLLVLGNLIILLKNFNPIILLAPYLGYQQYQLSRLQLRKNLFDKRIQIYTATISLASAILKSSPEIIKEKLNTFEVSLHESKVLFGQEVNQKIVEIYFKGYEIIALKSNMEDESNYIKANSDNKQWYESEDSKESIEQFKYYRNKYKEIRETLSCELPEIETLFYPYINLSNIAVNKK
ncbi:hypothetical protein NIES2111_44000 [Nostoc sp. NIES-2111]|nr:hypothetical protein NIES2111_44000 [Nostoc sp. NIES-2111]